MYPSALEPNLVKPACELGTPRKRKEPPHISESALVPYKAQHHACPHTPRNKRTARDSGFASVYSQTALISDESLLNGYSHSNPLETGSSSSLSSGTIALSTNSAVLPPKTRSNKSLKYVGVHVSVTSGGLQRTVQQAQDFGARAFGLFVRSARRWTSAPLSDDSVRKFRDKVAKSGIQPDKIVCHGSYLINLGSPAADILRKSRLSIVDEMKRCERLGISYYNIHPGSTCGRIAVSECIERIVDSVNETLVKTKDVILLLETMCCQGYTVGGKLSELKEIIGKVQDKGRIGVCLDTCHVYSAGHDINKRDGWERFMKEFDDQIGLDKLKAIHLNDSELPVGSHLDKHSPIGKGWIGMVGFKLFMNDVRLNNIPMILETSDTAYRHEIDLLYSLCRD